MSMDASKWLWSIIPKTKKRSGRESLEGVHHHSDCVFSTDSYRVHIWHLSNTGPCEVCTKKDTITLAPIFRQVAESQTRFTVSTKHLKTLCKQAQAFTENNAENPIRLSVNGCLQASAVNAETGDWASELHDGDSWPTGKRKSPAVIYQKSGPDTFFGLSPKYLLQALSGMPEIVEVACYIPSWPVSIKGGDVQAIIMPINLVRS